MQIFTEDEARYFCHEFDRVQGNVAESIIDYRKRELRAQRSLSESSQKFNDFRSYLLRDVERCLFMAASNYYATHRQLSPGFASWAHVTSYYAAYYSARAILGMFGIYIDAPNIIVDVSVGNIGSQELRVTTNKNTIELMLGGIRGPHKQFWSAYYQVGTLLHSYVTDPVLRVAISPVSASNTWQIDNRNDVNYDMIKSVDLICQFENTFKRTSFPNGLPGILNTQFKITEATLLLAFKYAKEFALNTDALDSLPGSKSLRAKVNRYIIKSRRGISVKSEIERFVLS